MSASTLSINSTLALRNSQYKIPQIGFGVYQSPTDVCVKSCKKAFEAGYRHIDTAQYYANEEQVGQSLAESGLPREDVYITSKILSPGEDIESTYDKVVESVEKLAGKDGYADLFLIHSPSGGPVKRRTMWLALKKAKEQGKVREIGVSNYGIQHIDELSSIDSEECLPAVNQIEVCHSPSPQSQIKPTNATSFTPGANSARLSSTAESETSSSKPIAPSSETRRQTTRPSLVSQRSTAKSPIRFSSDGAYKRASYLSLRATRPLALSLTPTCMVSNWTRRTWLS